jgi:hypothetical protein
MCHENLAHLPLIYFFTKWVSYGKSLHKPYIITL